MIGYLLSQLLIFWYRCFPKYYFSMHEKSDANIYMVNIVTHELKRLEYKEVIKKRFWFFGKETKKKIAMYDVNCLPFYSISDKHAKIKAQKKINEFKPLMNVQ